MSENRQNREPRNAAADLREMTADELAEELAERWDAMDEQNFDRGRIDACLAELDAREPLAADFQPEAALAAFREKHAHLMERTESAARPAGGAGRPALSRRRRTARLAAAAAAVTLGCMLAAQALGVDVFGTIAHWTGETFRIGVPAQSDPVQTSSVFSEEEPSYTSLQEALDAYGVTEAVAPSRYPEGFGLIELKVTPTGRSVSFHAAYEAGEKFMAVSIRQFASAEDASNSIFEKDDTPVVLYERGGITHYIMSNYEQLTAVWMNGNLLCSIHGDLSEDELECVIDSVYEP